MARRAHKVTTAVEHKMRLDGTVFTKDSLHWGGAARRSENGKQLVPDVKCGQPGVHSVCVPDAQTRLS